METSNDGKLHLSLKKKIASDLDIERWHGSYQHLLQLTGDREHLCIKAPEWCLPVDELINLCFCLSGLSTLQDDFITDLSDCMTSLTVLVSKQHNWIIKVNTVDTDGKIVSTY
ncbi:Hypothetical protein PHPALM_14793 [Phytophthora palmivora]|uniref:Uncharacterized protein n=1 Tax=Phytophthora palmivora TaxID=4796 RepID=A0A2P4XTT3_9STRA|nr:Hypothetical protein PHPALM_14793 [Phytophthora palmivora]